MTVWFTADLHLGHRLVAGLRGFSTPEEHDEAILSSWSVVRPADQVWVLGDVALGSLAVGLAKLSTVPGHKHLVVGNHDSCHPMHRSAHQRQRQYLEVFESVQAFARRRVAGRPVLLSHFPYCADHSAEVRYRQWRLPDLGELLLHGHTHSVEVRTSETETHVGLDAWGFRPVSLEHLLPQLAL